MSDEKKYMTIITHDGKVEKVEVLFNFELTDLKKDYVVYTNGIIDENQNSEIYVMIVDRSTNPPKLSPITDMKEYYRVRNIIHNFAYGYGLVNKPNEANFEDVLNEKINQLELRHKELLRQNQCASVEELRERIEKRKLIIAEKEKLLAELQQQGADLKLQNQILWGNLNRQNTGT